MCLLNLADLFVGPTFFRETQENNIPIRKFKILGLLPGNSGIQNSYHQIHDSCQEIGDFTGSQTLYLLSLVLISNKLSIPGSLP